MWRVVGDVVWLAAVYIHCGSPYKVYEEPQWISVGLAWGGPGLRVSQVISESCTLYSTIRDPCTVKTMNLFCGQTEDPHTGDT